MDGQPAFASKDQQAQPDPEEQEPTVLAFDDLQLYAKRLA